MSHFSTQTIPSAKLGAATCSSTCNRSLLSRSPLHRIESSAIQSKHSPVGVLPSGVNSAKRHVGNRSRRVTTMAAKVTGTISLALEAGKANPAPPVGPALGAQGVNIMQFCKQYNSATADKAGQVIPVEITVFSDKSFTFILKTPPASFLLKKAAGIEKGSGNPNDIVGEVTVAQLKEIAEVKLPDLNCSTIEAAMETVKGTAKNMGITVAAE